MVPPEAEAITDEESAVAHVASLLEPDTGPPEQVADEPEQVPPAVEEPAEPEKESSEPTDEPEPEGEDEELPDTLEAFAEALGVEPDAFAGHLKVPLKVNGKVEYVPLAEAMKGARLEADYSQKTMELADQRRQMEAEAQQRNERWQQESQRLNDVIASAEEMMTAGPSQEELNALLETDPQEYLRATARQQAIQIKLEQAKQERDRFSTEQQQAFQTKATEFRADQQRLLGEKMPEVLDPDKLKAFESGASSYLRDFGFTDEEVKAFFGGPFDHRHVLMIRDGMKYRAMEKGKKELPKKLKGLPKVVKPGAAQKVKGEEERLVASKDRLKRLRTKGTRQQQNDAAVAFVKGLL